MGPGLGQYSRSLAVAGELLGFQSLAEGAGPAQHKPADDFLEVLKGQHRSSSGSAQAQQGSGPQAQLSRSVTPAGTGKPPLYRPACSRKQTPDGGGANFGWPQPPFADGASAPSSGDSQTNGVGGANATAATPRPMTAVSSVRPDAAQAFPSAEGPRPATADRAESAEAAKPRPRLKIKIRVPPPRTASVPPDGSNPQGQRKSPTAVPAEGATAPSVLPGVSGSSRQPTPAPAAEGAGPRPLLDGAACAEAPPVPLGTRDRSVPDPPSSQAAPPAARAEAPAQDRTGGAQSMPEAPNVPQGAEPDAAAAVSTSPRQAGQSKGDGKEIGCQSSEPAIPLRPPVSSFATDAPAPRPGSGSLTFGSDPDAILGSPNMAHFTSRASEDKISAAEPPAAQEPEASAEDCVTDGAAAVPQTAAVDCPAAAEVRDTATTADPGDVLQAEAHREPGEVIVSAAPPNETAQGVAAPAPSPVPTGITSAERPVGSCAQDAQASGALPGPSKDPPTEKGSDPKPQAGVSTKGRGGSSEPKPTAKGTPFGGAPRRAASRSSPSSDRSWSRSRGSSPSSGTSDDEGGRRDHREGRRNYYSRSRSRSISSPASGEEVGEIKEPKRYSQRSRSPASGYGRHNSRLREHYSDYRFDL
jgi:hypothetical protein